jgi:hypothetical protein
LAVPSRALDGYSDLVGLGQLELPAFSPSLREHVNTQNNSKRYVRWTIRGGQRVGVKSHFLLCSYLGCIG